MVAVATLEARSQADGLEYAWEAGWNPIALVAGGSAGLLATTTGASGPPIVLYLRRLELGPGEVRDALAATFLAINLFAALAITAFAEGFTAPGIGLLTGLAGATLLGQALGRLAFERMAPHWFRWAGLGLVLAAGIASVVAGVVG